ncbi:MAG: hypothetical protein U5N86_08465 [Planctomycetota bacterium]|nr:hypothetical protein [Planctomycetota bacterium]
MTYWALQTDFDTLTFPVSGIFASTPYFKDAGFQRPSGVIWGARLQHLATKKQVLDILNELDEAQVPGLALTWHYDDSVMERIAQMKHLRFLHILHDNCKTGEVEIPRRLLDPIASHRNLRYLSFYSKSFAEIDVPDLSQMTALEELTLNTHIVEGTAFCAFSAPNLRLVLLNLNGAYVPYDAVKKCEKLEALILQSAENFSGMAFPTMKKLKWLSLLSQVEPEQLFALTGKCSPTKVELLLTSDSHIKAMKRWARLESLSLFQPILISPIKVKAFRALKKLSVGPVEVNDELLNAACSMRSLEKLWLQPRGNIEFGKQTARKLAGKRSLKDIRVYSCPFTEEREMLVNAIAANSSVEHVELLFNSVHPLHEDELAALCKSKSIRELAFFGDGFVDLCYEPLGRAGSIAALTIAYPMEMTEKLAQTLSGMSGLRSLTIKGSTALDSADT